MQLQNQNNDLNKPNHINNKVDSRDQNSDRANTVNDADYDISASGSTVRSSSGKQFLKSVGRKKSYIIGSVVLLLIIFTVAVFAQSNKTCAAFTKTVEDNIMLLNNYKVLLRTYSQCRDSRSFEGYAADSHNEAHYVIQSNEYSEDATVVLGNLKEHFQQNKWQVTEKTEDKSRFWINLNGYPQLSGVVAVYATTPDTIVLDFQHNVGTPLPVRSLSRTKEIVPNAGELMAKLPYKIYKPQYVPDYYKNAGLEDYEFDFNLPKIDLLISGRTREFPAGQSNGHPPILTLNFLEQPRRQDEYYNPCAYNDGCSPYEKFDDGIIYEHKQFSDTTSFFTFIDDTRIDLTGVWENTLKRGDVIKIFNSMEMYSPI